MSKAAQPTANRNRAPAIGQAVHGPHAESQGENALGTIRAHHRRDLFSASALLRRAGPTDFPLLPNFRRSNNYDTISLRIAEFTDRASPAGFISR